MHSRIIIKGLVAFTALLLIATLVYAAPAHASASASTLSIQSVYVTDSGNHAKSSFKSGDGINYHIVANNSGTIALSVSVEFWADTHDNLQQHIIVDKSFAQISMPPGLSNWYTISKIPAGTVSGTYTFLGLVYESANHSNSASLSSSPFSIVRVLTYPLQVPVYSQDTGEPSGNDLCGETSVAMVISYYIDVLQYTDKPTQLIDLVAVTIGVNKTTTTSMQNLHDGLWLTDQKQIFSNSTELSGSKLTNQMIQTITTETKNGNPVIAYVDGTKYVHPRGYVGHWIVITGIIGDTVYVNDPDDFPKMGVKVTSMPLKTYEAAALATDGVTNQGSPSFGLVVYGEQFQSA